MFISSGRERSAFSNWCRRLGLAAAAGVFFLFVSPLAQALQPPSVDIGQGGWWMGIGYFRYQRPYVGNGHWNRIVPMLNIDMPHYFVHGLTFGWRAWQNGTNSFALIARPDALGYNAATNSALSGMTTKLPTVMGGVTWDWAFYPHFSLKAEALTDLLRRNDGEVLGVSLGGRWEAGSWFFHPRFALDLQSSNYVDYYYGVTAAESRPGRPQYAGKTTIDATLGLDVGRTFGRHFAATLGAYETRFGSGITSSPIVSRSDALSLLFAVYYRF